MPKGSFTVVTGRIGAGKTTLLETMLGLLPAQAGEVHWNGESVTDLMTFFRPPRVAYTPQTPRLFSDTLRNNIVLGAPLAEDDLRLAVHRAVMERDTSAAFVELLAMVNSQRVKLLDHPVLIRELQRLERRTGSSGRDHVSHPVHGHDDVAAAAAGALLGAKSGRGTYTCRRCQGAGCHYCGGEGRLRDIGITL